MFAESFHVICIFACLIVTLGNPFAHFRFKKYDKLYTAYVDKFAIAETLAICVNICELETSFYCQTISWRGKTCMLSKRDRQSEYYWPFSEKYQNWITVCRITYAVYMATGEYGENYILTFEEAKTRCEASGSAIASREDLLEARQMGLDWCECGWLSDGTAGYVQQSNYTSCSEGWNDGIMRCPNSKTLYNVWCKSYQG